MDAGYSERVTRARALRQSARYTEALALLAGSEDWPAPDDEAGTLLQGQILARRAPLEALELFARASDVFRSPRGRFGYYVASMRAYSGTRNFESAAEMGAQARALIDAVDEADKCLLWVQHSFLRLCLEQFDPLDDNLVALIKSSDPNGRFLGYASRSYHHAGLGQFPEQKADLCTALTIAMAHPGVCDPGFLGLQVFGLMRLALETGDEASFAIASDAYDAVPWTDDIADDRFNAMRSMAWEAFLRGESARAQWLFSDARKLAKSDAWRVMCHLDRAFVARANGNEFWATEELMAAQSLGRRVEWSTTRGEERQALVMLAVMSAPTDLAAAQRYVSQYIQLGRESVDPGLSLATDRRAIAFEKHALGRVQQVLGNNGLAMKSLEGAYDIFDSAGYHFRAALAAMAIFETTGDAAWKEKARAHAAVFPHSPLYETLNRRVEPAIAPQLRALTPMQRQIAFALSEGLELADMSRRFSRSAFTIGKHVDTVFATLGVKNGKALRAALEGWTVT